MVPHYFKMFSLLVIVLQVHSAIGASRYDNYYPTKDVNRELLLTREEKLAFDKFKTKIIPAISKEWKEYFQQDLFLLRWIRARNLNVEKATQDMLEFMDFLNKNKMGNILDEDFSDFEPDYPLYMDAVDRKGRPVLYYSLTEGWNTRAAVLQGKRSRLMRYSYRACFQLYQQILDMGKSQPNITQAGLVIINLDGFNVFEHSCPACITTYINLLDMYERYIPGYVKEIVVINATQAYLILLEILRPSFSPYTKKTLHVFGTNKSKWKPYLDQRIDPSQLPWDFGGTRMQH